MSGIEDRLKDPLERSALIAALVAGHCLPAEAQALREAATRDPQLAREIELMELLRQHMHQQPEELPEDWGWHRLRREMGRDTRPAGDGLRARWLPAATAALLAVCVMQGLHWWQDGREGYQPLGDSQTQVLLQLRFQPEARQSDIQALLHELNAEIVAGPSSAGVYRLRLFASDTSPQAIERALEHLRKQPVVSYVGREP